MSRKRCHRRPVPVRNIPLAFSFSDEAKINAMLQARATLKAVLDHTATEDDLAVLVRIALYCNEMCVKMIKERTVESDGLADVAQAVAAGMVAVNSIIDRHGRTSKVGTAGPEREPLE